MTERTYVDHQELDRIASFEQWPAESQINTRELAAAGFFYIAQLQLTRCFSCQLEIRHWEPEHNPWTEHRRSAPHCRFMSNLPSGNVGINEDVADIPTPPRRYSREYEMQEIDLSANSASRDLPTIVTTRTTTTTTTTVTSTSGVSEQTRIVTSSIDEGPLLDLPGPVHRQYLQYDDRVRSFAGFPLTTGQLPAFMAEAGFFYGQSEDLAVCFYCGKGLKDWEPCDDPWEEHARWHGECEFVQMFKGRRFTHDAQHRPAPPPEEPLTHCKDSDVQTERPDLPEQIICKYCLNKEVTTVILPCGHLVSCRECADKLLTCGFCRRRIQHRIRVYFA